MLMAGERLGAVCAGTVRLEENLRLVGRLEAKNPETGKDGSCCCCCCWQLPLVAMGSETLFSLRSSFFSLHPNFVWSLCAPTPQHRASVFLFHSRPVGHSGERTKAKHIRINVCSPGSDRSPKSSRCVPELRLSRARLL